MEFPAFLYDVTMDKRYYSSDNFKKASEKYGIRESDYWSPQLPHTSHALCDCIHMKRYRLLKGEAANEPRISWVTIPIESAGVVQAYFCVMESRKFLDFLRRIFHAHCLSDAPGNLRPAGGRPGCQQYRV